MHAARAFDPAESEYTALSLGFGCPSSFTRRAERNTGASLAYFAAADDERAYRTVTEAEIERAFELNSVFVC